MTETIDIGWVDIGLAAFLLLSIVIGLMRGFVFELLSLVGWFVAYFVALWFTPTFQPYLHVGDPGSALNYGATFACVFLASLVIWGLGSAAGAGLDSRDAAERHRSPARRRLRPVARHAGAAGDRDRRVGVAAVAVECVAPVAGCSAAGGSAAGIASVVPE